MENRNLWRRFSEEQTPFYLYDLSVLRNVLAEATKWSNRYGFKLHYAMKANANLELLQIISDFGLGADCVSGNEILHAVDLGFSSDKIVFAGVGKTDQEIRLALNAGIFAFNVESSQELEVINQLAGEMNKNARIALRINPDVNPLTHEYISTGQSRNKFGIPYSELPEALEKLKRLSNLKFIGLHFHIGSQITQLDVYRELCDRVNVIQDHVERLGFEIPHLNMGGGLGINYEQEEIDMPDFRGYFSVFHKSLLKRPGQTIHFEPGRSIVAACGTLITKVLYVKENPNDAYVIVDAGMTELIRPALYQSYHPIENLNSANPLRLYAVAGPVCESSDFFTKKISLPQVERGNLLAIKQVGAYGEVMSSRYNLRSAVRRFHVDDEALINENQFVTGFMSN
jgi:diaminopimelate decarboxylase